MCLALLVGCLAGCGGNTQTGAADGKGDEGEAVPGAGGDAAGFDSVTGKGGIKVIDGSSVKFGRFDGAQPHCVGLTDLVTDQDGSSMAAGFMQWENAFFPWTLNYDEIDMVLEGELHVRHQGETLVAKAGDVMFIPKGSSIEFGTPSTVRFLYVAWPANWQSL